MKLYTRALVVLGFGSILCATAGQAQGATTSNTVGVALTATLTSSITLTVLPTVAAFSNVGVLGLGTGALITVTSNWALSPGANLSVYGYFATAAAAMTDGASHNIPSSAITGVVDAGTATAFTQTSPFGTASSLLIYNTTLTALTAASLHIDTVTLGLNLAGLTSLPPATYTGTLFIEAQAV